MTELEWLTASDPEPMLLFVKQYRKMRKQNKLRRQRLFSVACCRRIWPLIASDRSRCCVEVAERFADGQATDGELQTAEAEASAIWQANGPREAHFACVQVCYQNNDGLHVSTTTLSAVFDHQRTKPDDSDDVFCGRVRGACPAEERAQSNLLRDIFGNPFRPVAFDPVWRTEAAVGIARGIYEDRAFERMPILADALQEAGCEHPDILTHCREPGEHVRGCWVVDLVLGKS